MSEEAEKCPKACVIEATYPRITLAEQALIARIPGINTRLTTCETKIGTIESTVASNKEACDAAHGQLRSDIDTVAEAVVSEKNLRESAETALSNRINAKAATTALEEVDAKVDSEVTARTNAITAVETSIAELATQITTERTSRTNADTAIRTDVNLTVSTIYSTLRSEANSLKAELEQKIINAKGEVADDVSDEASLRQSADTTLTQSISDEENARKAKDAELTTLIGTKETSITSGYQTADAALQAQITTNANRITENKTLFDTAKTALEAKDATLTSGLANEITNRENADTTNLQLAKDYAKSLLSSALNYQGQVADLTELETKTATALKGDMYNVLSDGTGLAANYAFNGTTWDKLTESIDLTPFATHTEVSTERTRAEAAETSLEDAIAANTLKINTDVGAERSRATTAETTLQTTIDNEEDARIAADNTLRTSINTLSGTVTTEVARLESLIASSCNAKETTAISRENAIKAELQAKDNSLELSINSISSTVAANKTAIENALAQEVANRTNAVAEVRNQLTVTEVGGTSRLVGMGEVLAKIDNNKTDIATLNASVTLMQSQKANVSVTDALLARIEALEAKFIS